MGIHHHPLIMTMHTAQPHFVTVRHRVVRCDPHMFDHPQADLLAWEYETQKVTSPTTQPVAFPYALASTPSAIADGLHNKETAMIGLLLHLLDHNQVPDTEWRYLRLRQLHRAAQVDLELARRNPDLTDAHLVGLARDVRQLDAELKRMEPLRPVFRRSDCDWNVPGQKSLGHRDANSRSVHSDTWYRSAHLVGGP
jgi:hypothetical protein